jgi:hypothetical protein
MKRLLPWQCVCEFQYFTIPSFIHGKNPGNGAWITFFLCLKPLGKC